MTQRPDPENHPTEIHRTEPHRTEPHRTHEDDTVAHDRRDYAAESEQRRHEEFGGFNFGAAFFGWLVAIAMTILLIGIAGAIAAAAGESMNLSQSDAEREAGTLGIAGGVILLVLLMIAYYAGGYVAGRMSRFDGGRQGLGVWIFGLLVTIAVAVIGAIFGSEYNVLDRVNLPTLPVSTDELTTGGAIALVAVLLGTLLAAIVGGIAGRRYHTKIDRAGY